MKRLLGAVLLALGLSACATSEGYHQQMSQFIGMESDLLMIEFGAPDRIDTLNSGGEVWSYDREEQRTISGGYRTLPREYRTTYVDRDGVRRERIERYEKTVYEPGQSWWVTCDTRFVISPEGRVADFRFSGEACVAPELY